MKLLILLAEKWPPFSSLNGWLAFQVGVFLLPSSAFLSGLFLIFSLIYRTTGRSRSYLADKWNWPWVVSGFLMLLGCFGAYSGWLAWVGLANWIPFFWAFWGFQRYLCTAEARRRIALLFVAGSVPVVLTGFGQLWLGWHGPWELFNGLIIWFVAPGGQPLGRLSGLFDYANIAGAWLALVWPFSLAALLQPSLSLHKRSLALIVASSIVAALVLTDSRNAWGGLIVAIPFVFGPTNWRWLLPLLVLVLAPVALAVLPGIGFEVQAWSRRIVPEGVWARLTDIRYFHQRSLASTRLSQWGMALNFLGERPLLGWGAAAFSVLYPLRTGQWHGHSHNLPLELGVSHGIAVSFLITSTVIALLITALRRGVLGDRLLSGGHLSTQIFDRAWWTASFILVALHGSDLPFFDSRLNIAGWILLAGLRCLILPVNLTPDFDLEPDSDVRSISQA